jgi:hypothetical protein
MTMMAALHSLSLALAVPMFDGNASKGIRFCKQPIHSRASATVSRFL